jgi:hypothetical protein
LLRTRSFSTFFVFRTRTSMENRGSCLL